MSDSERRAAAKETTSQRTCATCGYLCDRAGEYHPFLFCQLKRAGVLDPWEALRNAVTPLGVELPVKPPLVRNLRRRS